MLSTRTTRWSAVTGLVCVIILVATWFLLVGPRRSDAAALDEQRVSVEEGNTALQARIAELQKQFGELPARQAELKAIRKQLPSAAEVPTLVRNLSSLAELAGVTLDSVAPGTPRTLSPGVAGAEPAIIAIPVTMEVKGGYVADTIYLRYLQTRMTRAFLITEISASRAAPDAAADTSGGAGIAGTVPATPAPDTTVGPTVAPTFAAPAPAPPAAPEPTSASDEFEVKIVGEIYALVDAGSVATGAGTGPGAAAPAPSPTAPAASPAPPADD